MVAPTFVSEYEVSTWTTNTTPKSVSVTTQPFDLLVWIAATRDSATTVGTLSAGTGMSWNFVQYSLAASNCAIYIGTALATVAETFTLSGTATSTSTIGQWGFNCLRFANTNGWGAGGVLLSTGIPSITFNTTQDDSAIVVVNGDWNAVDGAARSWLTSAGAFTELTYARQSLGYTVYGGIHSDAGPAGSKTVGLSNIAGQKYSIAALEILGIPIDDGNRRKRELLVR